MEEDVDVVVGGDDSPTSVGEITTTTTVYDLDDLYYVGYLNNVLLCALLFVTFISGMFGKGWRK